ncbi:MAG: hypothetical protein AAB490_01130 [Patescibacteria group bacterium]
MEKLLYKISADIIWLLHFAAVCIALFGWLIPSLWFVYISVLIGTLISTLALGYCVLSKWEFDLRKKIEPTLAYDFVYSSYYTYRLTRGYLSNSFLARAGVIFCAASLAINFYFR